MKLGLTSEEWRRLYTASGVIITIMFVLALVTAAMGFYSEFTFFTGVLGVVGVIASGALYITSAWVRPIRPVVYVAVMVHSLCPMLGTLVAGFVLHVIHQLF